MSELSEKLLEEACESLELVTGILLNSQQMKDFLSGTRVEKSLIEWGEVDTQDRENLADMLSMKLINKEWPCYSDKADMEKFALELNEAAIKQDYQVQRA